ncbi:porin family protein [Hymenobacter sp. HD11105]
MTIHTIVGSCLLLSVGSASAAVAQGLQLGVKAGIGEATVHGNYRAFLEERFQTVKALHSLYGGIRLTIPFPNSRFFSYQPELVYVRRGTRLAVERDNVRLTDRSDYLDMPLLVRYTRQGFLGEAGPQFGYFLRNRTRVQDDLGSRHFAKEVPSDTRVSLGFTAGVGYQLATGPLVGARYTISYTQEAVHALTQLYVGYTFGQKRPLAR